MPIFRNFFVSTLIAGGLAATGLHAQGTADPAGTADVSSGTDAASIDAQFAAGRHDEGRILANIGRRFVMGDKLMLDVVFAPTSDGMEIDPEGKVSNTTIYSGLTSAIYEAIYLVAGDQKYMLVRDTDDKPAAPGALSVKGEGPIVGQWNGMFPAPPANTPVMLYLPQFSPIGPFSVPSN